MVERSTALPVNLAGSGSGQAPVTALSPKSGQVWPSSVSQSAMTKSIRGASGPMNSFHDLQCSADDVVAERPRACAITSGIGSGGRVGAGGIGAESPAADLVQDCLGHDRAGGVARAQEQHVECRGHAVVLLRERAAAGAQMSPHNSGRPPQQASVRKTSSSRNATMRTA